MHALRLSMWVGAVYDLAVGATIVLFLEPLSRILPIPFPQEPFYARMQGMLLIALGVFYAFAAHDLERNLRNVAGAVFARTAGGAYLVGYALTGAIAPFFHVFGLIDLGLAAWHVVLLRRAGLRFLPLLLRGDGRADP